MSITIGTDSLGSELAALLTQYGEYTTEAVKEAIDTTAEELVAALKRDSPADGVARKPKYREHWEAEEMYEDNLQKRVTVHNTKAYQLTHLLENGHAKANGGRVAPRVHIQPNEEKAVQDLERRIEEAARGK